MALQSIINVDIDFYDKKYILINAKQNDKNSRFLSVTCYENGKLYSVNKTEYSAYIRYKKSDNYNVFNFCEINHRGNIIVELTEQMLASEGICHADLVIVNKEGAKVDANTGEIIGFENSSILSTMPIHIDVIETAVANSEIESSYEFDGLNELLERAEKDYTEVILASKSWAIGGTGMRDNEDTNNSKYYSNQSFNSASSANASALNAANSQNLASQHMHDALVYSQNAQTYMNATKTYMDNADQSRTNALQSEKNAKTSETNAKTSETNAASYMGITDGYMKITEGYMDAVNGYMETTSGYMKTTESHMNATDGYMDKTEEFMNITSGYMGTTQGYMETAKSYMDNAETYMNSADTSMNNAKTSETNAATSESNANSYMNTTDSYMKTTESYMNTSEEFMETSQEYMNTTEGYMNDAKSHMDNAATSETNAALSEINASNSATLAQSYAVGGTGTRDGEDFDNAHYYCEVVKNVVNGLNSGFIPMGTITFAELAMVEKATGFTYNISDDFITDNTFAEGEGKSYTAGTNVYARYDGLWDCFGGAASPTATVDEVIEYLGLLM